MNSQNQDLLNQIERYKKLIINAKEEKLRIDLNINTVSKSLKEFGEKKELRRRELLNELIPVREEDFIGRNIQSAPENMSRVRHRENADQKQELLRNARSADPQNYNLSSAIQQSIKALPGISEQLKNSDMLEMFRQSYARDLKDFLKIREKQLNADGFQQVDLNSVDKLTNLDQLGEAKGQHLSNQPMLFPGANFSFKKKSQPGDGLNFNPGNVGVNPQQEQDLGPIRKKLDLNGPGLDESEVTHNLSNSGLIRSISKKSKSGSVSDSQNMKNSKARFGKKPKIKYGKSVNQSQSSVRRSKQSTTQGEIIEQIDNNLGESYSHIENDTQFGGGESEMFDSEHKRNKAEPVNYEDDTNEHEFEEIGSDGYDSSGKRSPHSNKWSQRRNYQNQQDQPDVNGFDEIEEDFQINQSGKPVKEHEVPTFRNNKMFSKGIIPDQERLNTHMNESQSQKYDNSRGFDLGNPQTEEFETYDNYGNEDVEKYWNDPNYDPRADRPSSQYSRQSHQRSREFRISTSNKGGSRTYSRGYSDMNKQEKRTRPNVGEPRMEAFTPKLEANANKEGEILKNYGEFGESDANFVKKGDDEIIDYFDNYEQSNEHYSGQYDYGNKQKHHQQDEDEIEENFEDEVSQNFTERNNRIIDRFDDFFGRMGIEDKKTGQSETLNESSKSLKQSQRSSKLSQSRNSKGARHSRKYEEAARMNQLRQQTQQDTNSSYSRPPSSLEASKESLKEQSLSRSKNSNKLSSKFNNFNTNVEDSDIFQDSDEERDTISEQFPPSAIKNGISSRVQSNYGGERSEIIEEEIFEISQGTKEKKDIFKNNLYKTGKSNRYGGYGNLDESEAFEDTIEDDDDEF